MSTVNPPPPFQFKGNISRTWTKWKEGFYFFLIETKDVNIATTTTTKKKKKTTNNIPKVNKLQKFIHYIGYEGCRIYNEFEFSTEDEKTNFHVVMTKFDEYCNPPYTSNMARYLFFTCRQDNGIPFRRFVKDLRKLSVFCEFGEGREFLIRDMITCGVQDEMLRVKLLKETNLTMRRAVTIGKTFEMKSK